MDNALEIRDLKTHFFTDAGVATAVDGVSLAVPAGKTVALVGESGCGKSVTALSVMRLVPDPPGRIVAGSILLSGKDVLALPKRQMQTLRGNAVSMIFQEPMTALNPVFRVGNQIGAVLRLHQHLSKSEARARTIALLERVGIPSPEERVDDYPHQMSGGMRQRVMIAMALACNPDLLIADEPTTALDVTIQAQILELLKELQADMGMAILLITHDLGVVADMAHEVNVMYAGKIVERAPTDALFANRMHPYTVGLFESLPAVQDERGDRLRAIEGQVPAATHFPKGCRFHPRCPHAMPVCKTTEPDLRAVGDDHEAACWLHDDTVMANQDRPTDVPEEQMEHERG